jgi:hypothetical protein
MSSRIVNIVLFIATAIIFMSTAYAQISGKTKTDAVKASPTSPISNKTIGKEAPPGTSVNKPSMTGTNTTCDTTAATTDAGYWTCTMHPEIHKTESGNCPICGMRLIFRKSDKDTVALTGTDHTNVKK